MDFHLLRLADEMILYVFVSFNFGFTFLACARHFPSVAFGPTVVLSGFSKMSEDDIFPFGTFWYISTLPVSVEVSPDHFFVR